MTAPAPAPVVLLPCTLDELVDRVADRVVERLAEHAPRDDEEPLLLSCSKLCRRLGVSRTSVYRWRGDGMPSVRCGDEHRYILGECLEWLRNRSKP